ncbi:rCG50683 [Rattus norvegicus]|uniref:RCG50683 n=1 Tax=Rattus norvegicus TaxID=10116 RepID=A6KC12_RAT|nr:rCG50683 [Rattus norvegicus]
MKKLSWCLTRAFTPGD